MNGLDSIADYINDLSGLTPEIIEMGGYTPTKTTGSAVNAPATPPGAILSRGVSGQLFAEVSKVAEAENYGCILFAQEPLDTESVTFDKGQFIINSGADPAAMAAAPRNIVAIIDVTKGRKKQFINLQPGTEYFFYFYATNSGGASQLSEVRSIICG